MTGSWKTCAVVLVVAGILGCKQDAPVEIDPEVEKQIKSRQVAFQELGATFKNLRDELASAKPNKRMIGSSVSQISSYSKSLENMFPAGTGPESGVKTDALARIWAEEQDFRVLFSRYLEAVDGLAQPARDEDYASLSRQAEVVGKFCQQCHDRYRKE